MIAGVRQMRVDGRSSGGFGHTEKVLNRLRKDVSS